MKFVKILSHLRREFSEKNFLFSLFLVVSLASSLFSADLLASLTNGKISDNSPGVKLSLLAEFKQKF